MVSEDKIDMSLDDIIASNKKGRGRGRGRGVSSKRGGGGRGGARGGARGGGRRDSTGPVKRGRGGNRSAPYNRPRNTPDKWEHDMYDGAGGARGGRADVKSTGLSTGSHLQISNLDFGVTESDVKELFSEFGRLKKATINYDSSGRSHGTADVIFDRREDAAKAFKTYNGVPLDGRAMKIEQVTPQVTTFARRDTSSRLGTRNTRSASGGNFNRGSNRGGNRGGSRGGARGGRGGRGGARGKGRGPPPSKEDLDKELDSYIEAAN